ncbi:MAG: hypothetical protein ABFR97_08875 [Thermodesulfobacteriota bacterium]
MIGKSCLFAGLLFLYGILFAWQENIQGTTLSRLSYPLPLAAQRVALGYLQQLGAEMLFVKASVFNGGLESGRDPLDYADPLAQHFSASAALHPQFVDTYFLCQATLPYINDEYVRKANEVLAIGTKARPDDFIPPFFHGFNHMYFLNEPLEAARIFRVAAARPNGEPLAHLANILAAEGGDVLAALLGLKVMRAAEKSEEMQRRYDTEIAALEKAVRVLEAITLYKKENGVPPDQLPDLVPRYLESLPDLGSIFTLEWQASHLAVVRKVARPTVKR